MMDSPSRLNRRMVGALRVRLPELGLEDVHDPRARRGLRWKLPTVLRTLLVGLIGHAQSFAETEQLSAELTPAVRHKLGMPRRLPDTTARDLCCRLEPDSLRQLMVRGIRVAHGRKALSHDALPMGVVSLDGKATVLPSCDDRYAQRQSQDDGHTLRGSVRTITACLVSSPGQPCLDAYPIPAFTNEMGAFPWALRALVRQYKGLDLFRLVTYDAGGCSLENAELVRDLSLHYFFGLKESQPTLLAEAQRLLGTIEPSKCLASTDEPHGATGGRWIRRLYLTEEMAGFGDWQTLRVVLRVESEQLNSRGERLSYDNRYFISSLPQGRLSFSQWLHVVRRQHVVSNRRAAKGQEPLGFAAAAPSRAWKMAATTHWTLSFAKTTALGSQATPREPSSCRCFGALPITCSPCSAP